MSNSVTQESAPEGAKPYQSEALLRPVVEAARGVFGAAASSVFILDADDESLVFAAVSGAGETSLAGRRFPMNTGVAGWVVSSHECLRLDDLTNNVTFSREIAESTGYVPQALMAAPLLFGGECVGVLEVLDWTEGSRSELEDLRLLSVIADQAAAAVWMLARIDPLTDSYADPRARQLCARIMQALSGFSGPELEHRISLLDSLAQMLDE